MNEVGRMADIAQKNLEEAMDMVISKDDSKKKMYCRGKRF